MSKVKRDLSYSWIRLNHVLIMISNFLSLTAKFSIGKDEFAKNVRINMCVTKNWKCTRDYCPVWDFKPGTHAIFLHFVMNDAQIFIDECMQ